MKPDDARSWSNLGWAQLQLGHAPQGLKAALRAIEIDQEFAQGWMCPGMCERGLEPLVMAGQVSGGKILGDAWSSRPALEAVRRERGA